MDWLYVLIGILGIALLMIVHELGHLLAARLFKMRVQRFSIGFGPALWTHQPENSETVYQIALIPFVAYVQIVGMNPFEEIDADDKGSYANASLLGRISAIFAGPLANYLFASVLFFACLLIGGKPVPTTALEIMPDGAAAKAGLKSADRVVAIDGQAITDWEQLRNRVLESPGHALHFAVERQGQKLELTVTPEPKAEGGKGQIGVTPVSAYEPMAVGEAAVASVTLPPRVVEALVVGLARIITGKEAPKLTGPIGIVGEVKRAAQHGPAEYLWLLAVLSAYLGGFNLLPFPALDGGRLTFLAFEAVTRRRPDAKMEAYVHAIGFGVLILLIAVVTVFDFKGIIGR